uniref:Uncharacterized protein n=2 Tax=Amphimedon queenslandica TaxID=400682 RepID=A0A1X7V9I4_AMPQE
MGSRGDWELTVEVVVEVQQGEEVVAEVTAGALAEVMGTGLTMTEVAVEGDQGEEEAEEKKKAEDQEIVEGQNGPLVFSYRVTFIYQLYNQEYIYG